MKIRINEAIAIFGTGYRPFLVSLFMAALSLSIQGMETASSLALRNDSPRGILKVAGAPIHKRKRCVTWGQNSIKEFEKENVDVWSDDDYALPNKRQKIAHQGIVMSNHDRELGEISESDDEDDNLIAQQALNTTLVTELHELTEHMNAQDQNGQTALIRAVIAKNINTIQTLVQLGASPYIRDNNRKRAFMYAVDSPEVVRALLGPQSDNLTFELVSAAVEGNVDYVQELVNADADVNATDMNGDTPLMHAVYWENPAILKALLHASDIDFDIQNNEGQTLLMLAEKKEDKEMLTMISKRMQQDL